MRKLPLAVLALMLITLAGCTTRTLQKDAVTPVVAKLEHGQKTYIARPGDGMYAEKVYPGSGLQVARDIADAVRPYASEIVPAPSVMPVEAALAAAAESGARYAFIPVITHWEPRVAAWSGIPTRVGISVSIYDIPRQTMLIRRDINVKGRTATFVSQHASDLAREAIWAFCAELY